MNCRHAAGRLIGRLSHGDRTDPLSAPMSPPVSPMPLGRRKRADEIAEHIERAISTGEFKEGDAMPSEKELAERFGVGRPSVREALFILQQQGLVEIASGARARVTAPSGKFLSGQMGELIASLSSTGQGQDHMEQARLLFEAGVAWQAAQIATDEDIERLQARRSTPTPRRSADIGDFIRTDVAFHYELAAITRNPVFIVVHEVLVGWLIDQRTTTIHMPDADSLSVRDHTAIYEAVAAREPMRAFHEMASHLRLISGSTASRSASPKRSFATVARDVAGSIERERERGDCGQRHRRRYAVERGPKPRMARSDAALAARKGSGEVTQAGLSLHRPRRARRGERGRPSFSAPAPSATASAWYLLKAGHRRRGRRAPGRGRDRDQLGQWRRDPRQRGRALVAARHAAQDPRLARQGECASPAALRRHSAHVALGARLRRQLHARAVPRQYAGQSDRWRCIRCGRCRRSGPRRALPMIAPPTASSRSTARAIRSMPRPAAASSWQHGLLFERVDGPGCVAHEPALADVGTSLAGGLYFARDEVGDCNKFTQGLAAACAARRRPPTTTATAVQRLETTGGRVTGVVTDKGRIAADIGSWWRWAASRGRCCAPPASDVPIYPGEGLSITFPRGGWNGAPRDAGDRRQQAVRPGADRRPDAHLRLGRDHRLRHHAGRCPVPRPSSPTLRRPFPTWRATSIARRRGSGPGCGR